VFEHANYSNPSLRFGVTQLRRDLGTQMTHLIQWPKPIARKETLSKHFFGFNIKQRHLFQVELDGHFFTQME
jgi:hypothetical protein